MPMCLVPVPAPDTVNALSTAERRGPRTKLLTDAQLLMDAQPAAFMAKRRGPRDEPRAPPTI